MTALAWMRFASSVARSGFGRSGFPYKLNFSVTGRCNCRCSHCHIWKKRCEEELSLDETRSFFERSGRFSWIDVTGGEIFLREDIEDVFELILENSRNLVLLHFPTNGTMPESAERLAKRIISAGGPRLYVTVSMDGPRELHDRLRGLPGCFDAACETFRRLKALRSCPVFFGMTIMSENMQSFDSTLADIRRIVPDITSRDFHFNLFHRSGHYYDNLSSTPPETSAAATGFAKLAKRSRRGHFFRPLSLVERRYAQGVESFCRTGRPPIPCKALSASVFVKQDGGVYPCTIWNRPLGNLRDHGYDLLKLWNLPLIEEAREEACNLRCPGCWTPCEAFPAILARWGLPFRFPLRGSDA
jgi:MoaA/NifB/PqqE/SkfB family radical SAM enzyme